MYIWNFMNPYSDPNTFERDKTRARRRKAVYSGLLITTIVLILAGGVGIGIRRSSILSVFLNVTIYN